MVDLKKPNCDVVKTLEEFAFDHATFNTNEHLNLESTWDEQETNLKETPDSEITPLSNFSNDIEQQEESQDDYAGPYSIIPRLRLKP